MTTDESGISAPVRRTAYAYVPAVAMFVGLANNIFSILGVTPAWQRRIVLGLLVSVPVVLAIAWIFGKPRSGDGWLARVSKTRSRRLAVAALPTIIAAGVLVWAIGPRTAGTSKVGARVAVQEFRDDSPQHDHAYLARGLQEELAMALERVPGMEVMEGPDSAAVIIEGAVGRWQDNLRITAKLIRKTDKRRLRTVRYDRPWGDVFAMQDSLSQDIVEELLPHIPRGQAKGTIEVNDPTPHAYDLYLRARYARDVERNVPKADSLFHASVAADPSFARARRELSALQSSAP